MPSIVRNHILTVYFVCKEFENRNFRTLTVRSKTLEMKNFHTHLGFTRQTFDSKANISTKPQNTDF